MTNEQAVKWVARLAAEIPTPYRIGQTVDSILHYPNRVEVTGQESLKEAMEMISDEYLEFQRILGKMPSQMVRDDAVMRETFKLEIRRIRLGLADATGQAFFL